MSTFSDFADRDFDMQDGVERHVWSKQTYDSSYGWMIKVKGTGTQDEEAMVIHGTMGFHLAEDSDTEVFLLASSSDTTLKYAIPSIPRDKQRQWKESTGGLQSPVDPKRAVEVNPTRTYVDDDKFATRGGVIEQADGVVIIRGKLIVQSDVSVGGDLTVAGMMFTQAPVGPGPVNVPAFKE